MSVANNNHNRLHSNGLGFLFVLFYVWTFILLSRPQDIFTALAPLRPAFTASLVVIPFFLFKLTDSLLYPEPPSHRIFYSRQTTLYTAMICLMMLGTPFAIYPSGAFLFATDYIIKVALFFFIFTSMVNTIRKLEVTILLGCIGTGFYATMAIMQGILKGQRLTYGKMFDPNDLAFFTLSFLTFNFLFVTKGNPLYQRTLAIINIISSLLVILMSGSRGGFLAFLFVLAMFLKKTNSIESRYKIAALIICLSVILIGAFTIDFSRYRTIVKIEQDYNWTDEWGRVAVWKKGIKYMITNPLTGVGVGCFDMAIGEDRAKQGLTPRWQTAHNSLILVGAETGVIGFVLFALMNLNAFSIFSRSARYFNSERLLRIGELAKIGFVGHFVCIIFLSQAYSFYWIFYIGLSCALDRLTRNDPGKESMHFPIRTVGPVKF